MTAFIFLNQSFSTIAAYESASVTIASIGIMHSRIFNGMSDTAPNGLQRSLFTLTITVLEALVISISKSLSKAREIMLPADLELTIKGKQMWFMEASQYRAEALSSFGLDVLTCIKSSTSGTPLSSVASSLV